MRRDGPRARRGRLAGARLVVRVGMCNTWAVLVTTVVMRVGCIPARGLCLICASFGRLGQGWTATTLPLRREWIKKERNPLTRRVFSRFLDRRNVGPLPHRASCPTSWRCCWCLLREVGRRQGREGNFTPAQHSGPAPAPSIPDKGDLRSIRRRPLSVSQE